MRVPALLILLTLAAATPASAQETMTEASLRTMPPDLLARRLLGESAALAFPLPAGQQARAPDDYGRTSVLFLMRPRASTAPGICETDSLVFLFDPLGAPAPNRPLRLHSMVTARYGYIVRDVAVARTGSWPDMPQGSYAQLIDTVKRAEPACAEIDPRRAEIVSADHAGMVGRGVALVADLLDSARRGRTTVPARCGYGTRHPVSSETCLQLLAALRVESLNSVQLVDGCWDMNRRGAFAMYNRCVRVRLWDAQRRDQVQIDFDIRWGPQELVRVDVRPYVPLSGDY